MNSTYEEVLEAGRENTSLPTGCQGRWTVDSEVDRERWEIIHTAKANLSAEKNSLVHELKQKEEKNIKVLYVTLVALD